MNRAAHYLKHPKCYYNPDCLRCYVRAFFEIMVLFVRLPRRASPRPPMGAVPRATHARAVASNGRLPR